jgi:hypothetical protein
VRKRLGGVGSTQDEISNATPVFHYGVPRYWKLLTDDELYQKLGIELSGVPIDMDDPPTFESEAAYLRRNDLFVPGERTRLTRADYYPNAVKYHKDDQLGLFIVYPSKNGHARVD